MNPKHQEHHWLQSVYRNCEAVGISGLIIERFEQNYVVKGNVYRMCTMFPDNVAFDSI